MQRKISFLICGTQKGGTTALADYLRQHPDVFIPEIKEIHFFDDESRNWKRPDYSYYHKNFIKVDSNKICGEATPIYMYWDNCAERIWKYHSLIKIIIILRNPISRAYSHWSMEYNRGNESLSFEEAIETEAIRSKQDLPYQHRIFSYIDRGFYCNQIRRLWRFFGKESVLILKQEQLLNQPIECLNQVYSHLEISNIIPEETLNSHQGKYRKPMKDDVHKKLRNLFWHEICQLESLLGWDCHEWLR